MRRLQIWLSSLALLCYLSTSLKPAHPRFLLASYLYLVSMQFDHFLCTALLSRPSYSQRLRQAPFPPQNCTLQISGISTLLQTHLPQITDSGTRRFTSAEFNTFLFFATHNLRCPTRLSSLTSERRGSQMRLLPRALIYETIVRTSLLYIQCYLHFRRFPASSDGSLLPASSIAMRSSR